MYQKLELGVHCYSALVYNTCIMYYKFRHFLLNLNSKTYFFKLFPLFKENLFPLCIESDNF